ncbi:hypothetical protein ABZP36_031564 [Zizania latifolia]
MQRSIGCRVLLRLQRPQEQLQRQFGSVVVAVKWNATKSDARNGIVMHPPSGLGFLVTDAPTITVQYSGKHIHFSICSLRFALLLR